MTKPIDWYCDEVLTGRQRVEVVLETDSVLAFHHTAPPMSTMWW